MAIEIVVFPMKNGGSFHFAMLIMLVHQRVCGMTGAGCRRMSAENVACDGADDPAPKRFLLFRPWHLGTRNTQQISAAPTSSQNHM